VVESFTGVVVAFRTRYLHGHFAGFAVLLNVATMQAGGVVVGTIARCLLYDCAFAGLACLSGAFAGGFLCN